MEAAQRHNAPGEFTAFVGYEFTSQPHRNLIFQDGDPATLPFTALDSQRPEDLWLWMDGLREAGVEVLAIPHSSNSYPVLTGTPPAASALPWSRLNGGGGTSPCWSSISKRVRPRRILCCRPTRTFPPPCRSGPGVRPSGIHPKSAAPTPVDLRDGLEQSSEIGRAGFKP